MAAPDRAYSILLSQLHKPSPALSLESLQGLISHCLSQTSTPTAATPLTATIISSPLFRPFSHPKLAALSTGFRHAAHLRLSVLKKEPQSIWSRGVSHALQDWTKAVIKGFAGGQGILRLVAAGGLLLALDDLGRELTNDPGHSRVRRRAEEEVVIAVAEVMDVYASLPGDGWEQEFHPDTERGEVDALSLALVFASQSLPLVAEERLTALPLHTLLEIIISSIDSAFLSGSFLGSLYTSSDAATLATSEPSSSSSSIPYSSSSSPVSSTIHTLSVLVSSPLFSSIAFLSKLCARSIGLLVETRPRDGWTSMLKVLSRLNTLCFRIDKDWMNTPLAHLDGERRDLPPEVQRLTASLWTIFKTLLFTSVMITQSILSAVLYVPPPHPLYPSEDHVHETASSMALAVLRIFSHLSFVISQFGGVTSQSEGGFRELRKTFYTALDILSADGEASERFVRQIGTQKVIAVAGPSSGRGIDSVSRSKLALDLACVEQLVSALSLVTIENSVFPLCLPLLNDPSIRELYESAHSVVLSTFASHARKELRNESLALDNPSLMTAGQSVDILEKMVPCYSACLLDNSGHGQLSTVQLRLAYGALVSSASATSDVMAQYCVSALWDKIKDISASTRPSESETDDIENKEQLHRLRLTLISTISALPLSLLPGVLDVTRDMLISMTQPTDDFSREEVFQALHKEILDGVGDREKEFVIRWWVGLRDELRFGELETTVVEVAAKGRTESGIYPRIQ